MLAQFPPRLTFSTLLILCVLLWWLPAAARGSSPAVLEQVLDLTLVPEQRSVRITALIKTASQDSQLPETFRLSPLAQIEEVRIEGRKVSFTFANGTLALSDLTGKGVQMHLRYEVRFDDPVPENTVGIEDPSFGISATITADGAFLSGAARWVPVSPGRVAIHEVAVSAPPGMVAVTQGRLIDIEHREDRTISRWQSRVPQPDLTLAAGNYQIFSDGLGDLQVLAFLTEENAALAPRYLAACKEYLELYQDLFGPYPYAKFAVVENFFPTGYGLPGWTLLGSTVVRLPFILYTSLPHEIAHAWWGNAIEVDYAAGNWAEGLATYVADYLLKERSSDDEAREYRLKLLRDYATLVDPEDDYALRGFRGRTSKLDQAIGYGKAAMVFHMLRNRLGDKLFWEGLQAVARHYEGGRASWQELREQFETVSGQDLDGFFRQWIERPGAPRIALEKTRLEKTAEGWVVAGAIRQESPTYRLELPLQLTTAQGTVVKTVAVAGPETEFRLATGHRPLRLMADPGADLFRRLEPAEIPVTVNALRAADRPLLVIAESTDADLVEASADLVRGLHWLQAPVVPEAQLTSERASGHDLLFIGWPDMARLPTDLPASIAVAQQQFTIDDIIFKNPHDALFLVLDKRDELEGVIGIFHPLSPAAARQVARKIPHYGRYSYLAFEAGNNQVKGTWSPMDSPLVVTFREGQE